MWFHFVRWHFPKGIRREFPLMRTIFRRTPTHSYQLVVSASDIFRCWFLTALSISPKNRVLSPRWCMRWRCSTTKHLCKHWSNSLWWFISLPREWEEYSRESSWGGRLITFWRTQHLHLWYANTTTVLQYNTITICIQLWPSGFGSFKFRLILCSDCWLKLNLLASDMSLTDCLHGFDQVAEGLEIEPKLIYLFI